VKHRRREAVPAAVGHHDLDAGLLDGSEPLVAHRAARVTSSNGDSDALEFLIGLAAPDSHQQPGFGLFDIGHVQRDQLGTAERASEAKQQQSALTQPGKAFQRLGDHAEHVGCYRGRLLGVPTNCWPAGSVKPWVLPTAHS
jgi:hypothetical protein